MYETVLNRINDENPSPMNALDWSWSHALVRKIF